MQVLLRIANGKSNVRKVRIQSDTVIGRSPECQLKVASNQISRRHCQIVIRDTIVAIKDLGSANGTFVNGRQVPPEVEIPLTPGTRVMLGPLQFTVEYELPGMPASHDTSPTAETGSQVDTETLTPASEPTGAVLSSDLQQVDTAPVSQTAHHLTVADSGPPAPAIPQQAVPPAVAQAQPIAVPTPLPAVPPPAQQFYLPPGYAPPAAVAGTALPIPVPLPVDPSAVTVPYPWPPAVPAPVQSTAVPQPMPIAPPAAIPGAAILGAVAPPAAIPQPTPALPAAVAQTASPVPSSFVPPVAPPAEQEETGDFNFGIFAASGSDVVVESANETPQFSASAEPSPPEAPKPARKGLLQMFGWGKKKAAEPAPEVAAEPEPVVDAPAETVAEESFQPPAAEEATLSFEVPDEEPAEAESAPDDSLQNFFNNFQ